MLRYPISLTLLSQFAIVILKSRHQSLGPRLFQRSRFPDSRNSVGSAWVRVAWRMTMPIELDVEAIRNRVIALRTERDWKQADLARESGISQATVSMIENGVRRVNDLGTAVRLANTFGLSMDEFLGHARPAADSLLGLKKRYAELQREEWTAWANCERAQAEFFRAEKRGATENDRRFSEAAGAALRAWGEAHRLTREAAEAMLARARENALRGGWDMHESMDLLPGRGT